MSGENTRWTAARSVLCVRLDALGDVLMTAPALRALKHSASGRNIVLLTSPAGAEVAALVPEVDETIVYEAPWMKTTPPRANAAFDLAMVERLRRGRFDAATIFTVYSQNPLPAALLCCLAEIPLRLAHCRENPYQLLSDWVPDPEPEQLVRHEVRRQLDLVAAIGCTTADERLSLQVPAQARARVLRALAGAGVDVERPWVLIHPGASAPSRRYPAEGFAAAARRLVREAGCRVVFAGGAAEVALVEQIRREMEAPSVTLAGGRTLAELAALIALAPLLVANNSGPAHIAAAVGTPVVELYALTNPQHTPWLVPSRVLSHDVPCRNCYKSICAQGHHDCLRRVHPDAVYEAVLELMDRRPAVPLGAAPARGSGSHFEQGA